MNLSQFQKFFLELEKNNNKPWFDAHRDEYQDIRKQLVAFVTKVHKDVIIFAPQFLELNPAKSLFRINRDVRFSPNKLPYKTGMGYKLVLGSRTSNCPGYGLWMDSQGMYIGGGTPKIETKLLGPFRDYFVANPTTIKNVLKQLEKEGFELSHEYTLKNAPRGYDPEHQLIDLLKLQGYRVGKFFPYETKTMSDQWLLETTVKEYEKMLPFVNILQSAQNFNPKI